MRKRLNPRAIAAAAKAVWEYRNPTCPWRRAPSLWRRRYLASSRKALEAALRVLDGAREPLHK